MSISRALTNKYGYFAKSREFRNISLSLAFRGGAILSNFLLVPLLISQLSPTEYGLLITIISISTWFTFVDFGLANGLKNKISESLAKGEISNVRRYISSAYFALSKVVLGLAFVLIILNFFVDWSRIIEGPKLLDHSVNIIFFYGLLLFLVRIVTELINPILLAYHKTAASAFIAFIAQLSILASCYILKLKGDREFLNYGLLFFVAPLLVYGCSNIYCYSTLLKHVKPARKFFEKAFQNKLFQLGGSFFVIQMAYLIVFMTDNLIIGKIFNYQEVSSYNIAFRYFNIPLFVLAIILTPYWPIFAESFINNETGRIKNIMRRLLIFWLLIVVGSVVMLFLAPFVYSVWVGPAIKVSFLLNLGMFFSTVVSAWNSIFAIFINSTSKLKLQTYSAIATGLLNIPLSIFLATKTDLGPSGVIFGTCICLLVGSIWAPIQCNKLINKKATGIWNK